jgi:hypothetical protein
LAGIAIDDGKCTRRAGASTVIVVKTLIEAPQTGFSIIQAILARLITFFALIICCIVEPSISLAHLVHIDDGLIFWRFDKDESMVARCAEIVLRSLCPEVVVIK